MQSGLSLSPCCMTSAGQNAGSSSDFPINPPLSGRAHRLTRICRVPRTNWRVHGLEIVFNVDPFQLPLRLSAMNTRAHSQVFGDFHLGTIADDLYVILPCLFPLRSDKQRQVLADDEVPTNQRISCRAWLDRNPSVQNERAEGLSFSLDKNRTSLFGSRLQALPVRLTMMATDT
ncbi:hypothetical protein BJX66DRAFT_22471 [Aspergillus keveii]|uniref:Uncharacterized protein n=1 Tax=Aspergillus keveii TaxID=714993 RepID=A0ABR4GI41_9EURO